MRIVPCSFAILTCLGGWRPVLWSPSWKTKLYDLLTCFMIFTIYAFAITQFIDLINSFDDVSEFTNNCFILLTIIGACSKVTNILGRRKSIIELINILGEDLCSPKNSEEIEIQYKFDGEIRRTTYLYAGLVEVATMGITMNALYNDMPQHNLAFNAWIPYSLDARPVFLFTCFYQIVANIICANVCAANETLVTGLMLQACAQLEILRYRLENLPKLIEDTWVLNKNGQHVVEYKTLELKIFSDCIKHHHRILELVFNKLQLVECTTQFGPLFGKFSNPMINFETEKQEGFSKSLNEIFTLVIFVQFAISAVVVCTSLFKLSKISITSVEFLSMILYLVTILVQIFVYCWYGNEVMLQSIEVGNAAYNMNWTLLDVSMQKNLLILMSRTLRPIRFTSGYVVVLSVESYNSLVKLSYSAYNGLQRSADR